MYVVIGVVVVIALSIILPAFVGGAWSPTKKAAVHQMLQLARLGADETLIDLGAGDGRVIATAAKHFNAHAIGIEVDPLRWLWCRVRLTLTRGKGRASVRLGNFFEMSLASADVVTFYLSQAAADKLRLKLEKELRPGSRVVSNRRPVTGWTPSAHDSVHDIYVYVMPAATTAQNELQGGA